ncbi:CHAP domain-containing protein [Falsiroseomonas sp. HC035]|uniref:CHAP domain-containing protein n=1 Tax=Falsiroseomonas sp. HC035 TaxID=3390999 RepID=UPI003D320CE8
MRARGTLAALCVLMGTSAISLPSALADRINPQAQAAAQRSTPSQRAARPAASPRQDAQARPVRTINGPQLASFRAAVPHVGMGTPILPVAATSGLSCVPFARMATGMNISGDARLWWGAAAGTYARGQQPERGAVLAFTASGGMSRGHVAVVSRVVGSRTIHIDHANWGGPGIRRGSVMRGVVVMDVSDRNDWTAVRVQVGHASDSFGRTYPTHGFIYNRPAGTRMMTAEAPALIEVAQDGAPHASQHLRLTSQLFE